MMKRETKRSPKDQTKKKRQDKQEEEQGAGEEYLVRMKKNVARMRKRN